MTALRLNELKSKDLIEQECDHDHGYGVFIGVRCPECETDYLIKLVENHIGDGFNIPCDLGGWVRECQGCKETKIRVERILTHKSHRKTGTTIFIDGIAQ